MSVIPDNFSSEYYNAEYFAVLNGKKFKKADGSDGSWSYANPMGEWLGCKPIVGAWKDIFKPRNMLDVGCGRGTFVWYCRAEGIETYGFDFSSWAIGNKYAGCDPGWITCHDATIRWPYGDKSFDLVTVLDLMEHLYLEDIDSVIDEMYRVSNKYVFLQIATMPGGGSGSGVHNVGYILKRGEKVPIELEGCVVAGHVTVCTRNFWIDRLMNKIGKDGDIVERKGWKLRDDLVAEFIKRVDPAVIDNWVKNTILVLEKV